MSSERLTFGYKSPPGIRRIPGEKPVFPLLPVQFNGLRITGLLDSGASSILIPLEMARALALKLIPAKEPGKGVGGTYSQYHTKVRLIVGGGTVAFDLGEVDACVPSQEQQDLPILIGRKPVFERFQITFEEYKEKFHLVPVGDTVKMRIVRAP
jgi:hypothetical protein